MQRLEFRAMGCHMTAVLDAHHRAAPLDAVPAWFEAWEQTFSRFRADSELNALNRADGKPFQTSETLWQVLQASLHAAQASNGTTLTGVWGRVKKWFREVV